MAVYGYGRVSTDRQADEGQSLEVQRRQIEGWALMHGRTVDRFVVDAGISGSVPLRERPDGGAMLLRLINGDTLVAAKLDRLFRSALDALQVTEELRGRGVDLVLLDLGGSVTGSGMSRLFLTITAAFAEAERDRIRERIRETKRDQKNRRRYLGGGVPKGWRVTPDGYLEEETAEQTGLIQARSLRDDGLSLRAIQRRIEDDHGIRISLGALHNSLQPKTEFDKK